MMAREKQVGDDQSCIEHWGSSGRKFMTGCTRVYTGRPSLSTTSDAVDRIDCQDRLGAFYEGSLVQRTVPYRYRCNLLMHP
jgi:hypothetical protein